MIKCSLAIIFPSKLQDSEEDALLEGHRCKDQKCDGFLLPDSGWLPMIRKILTEVMEQKEGWIKQTSQ